MAVALSLLVIVLRLGLVVMWGRVDSPLMAALSACELLSVCLAVWNMGAARSFDRSWWGVTIPLLYATVWAFDVRGGVVHAAPLLVVLLAVLVQFGATAWLGRCFSAGTSTWVGLVDSGPFSLVRHPIMALTFVGRLAWLAAFPSVYNAAATAVILASVVLVVLFEERYLRAGHSEYQQYVSRVPWRFVPGVW